MFHMANSSHLFRTAAQLEDDGFYPVQGNCWKRGEDLYLPLYEGKMVQAFDHRAASASVNLENLKRPSQSRSTTFGEYADASWLPTTRFWVPSREVAKSMPLGFDWTIGYRRVSIATNARTMLAAIVPKTGFGDSVFLLMPESGLPAKGASLLLGNINSFCFDFVTRQKMHGVNLSWYLVEQLPVIAPGTYDRRLGDRTAADLVRDHVLRLTYTAHDMAPFARDLGHHGPPFPWDPEQRRHLRARLDALYFHLYGLDRDAAAYILSTFPIIQRQDEAAFGTYRTRNLILAYMNALAAGDTQNCVSV